MSAAKLAAAGSVLKGAAMFAAVAAVLVAVAYVIRNAAAAGEAVGEAGGFLFGSDDAPATLGTWIYDQMHDAPDYRDAAQVEKTCSVLYPPGSGRTPKPGGMCEAPGR